MVIFWANHVWLPNLSACQMKPTQPCGCYLKRSDLKTTCRPLLWLRGIPYIDEHVWCTRNIYSIHIQSSKFQGAFARWHPKTRPHFWRPHFGVSGMIVNILVGTHQHWGYGDQPSSMVFICFHIGVRLESSPDFIIFYHILSTGHWPLDARPSCSFPCPKTRILSRIPEE